MGSRLLLEEGGRVRWGWRLALFLTLFVGVLLLLGRVAAGLVPSEPPEEVILWWGLGLSLLGALVASWVLCRFVEGMPLAALGLPVDAPALREFAAGSLIGAVAIGIAVTVLAVFGWVTWSVSGDLGAAAEGVARITLLLAGAALAEELLFRGYPFQVVVEGAGGIVALAATSVAFGLLHAGNPFAAPLPLANITLAGILLGLAYWKTWSLWFATGLHLGWNWTMGVAAGLPVSGLELSPPGLDAALRGPEVWTGGAFGPEGGLIVTGVTALAILWLWRTDRVGPSARVLALRPPPTRRWRAVRFPGRTTLEGRGNDHDA